MLSTDRESLTVFGGPKKWFMLQMWRIQQIAQIATIALLAMNLALLIYPEVEWRGGPFASIYTGVLLIAAVLLLVIWSFSIVWDLRMRMWREQHSVLVEKNPYTKEKLTAKEIVTYGLFWLPLVEKLAEEDSGVKESADFMREWLRKAYETDKSLVIEVDEITRYLGKDAKILERLLNK